MGCFGNGLAIVWIGGCGFSWIVVCLFVEFWVYWCRVICTVVAFCLCLCFGCVFAVGVAFFAFCYFSCWFGV